DFSPQDSPAGLRPPPERPMLRGSREERVVLHQHFHRLTTKQIRRLGGREFGPWPRSLPWDPDCTRNRILDNERCALNGVNDPPDVSADQNNRDNGRVRRMIKVVVAKD